MRKISIISMMDQLRQYEIGNVTKAGLLESLKEFEAELIENKTSENDWGSEYWLNEQYNRNREAEDQIDDIVEMKEPGVIKEYLTIKGKDFSAWWKSKSIAERQIITGYFGH